MNLKAIISTIAVLGLIVGGGAGWWAWGKWTASEERGVSLTLHKTPPVEQRPEIEEAYNRLLDNENFLQPIVKEMALMSFYGVESEKEAVELLRERSKVFFKTEDTIWIVHRAQRRERPENDRLGRMLGDEFVKNVFEQPGN